MIELASVRDIDQHEENSVDMCSVFGIDMREYQVCMTKKLGHRRFERKKVLKEIELIRYKEVR